MVLGDPVLRVNNVYILPLKTAGTGWSVAEKRNTVTILAGRGSIGGHCTRCDG